MSLRVVLDTSSLISFVLTTGDIMSQIVFAWRTEEFVLVTSWQTRAELNEVLDRPKIRALAKEPIERLKREVAKFSLFVDGADQISGVCRDPNDDKFLACAVAGQAHYLVSSDKDLLELKQYKGICILDPGTFLIALRLAKLTVDEIKATFSQETLRTIQENVCLEEETAVKLINAFLD